MGQLTNGSILFFSYFRFFCCCRRHPAPSRRPCVANLRSEVKSENEFLLINHSSSTSVWSMRTTPADPLKLGKNPVERAKTSNPTLDERPIELSFPIKFSFRNSTRNDQLSMESRPTSFRAAPFLFFSFFSLSLFHSCVCTERPSWERRRAATIYSVVANREFVVVFPLKDNKRSLRISWWSVLTIGKSKQTTSLTTEQHPTSIWCCFDLCLDFHITTGFLNG